MFNTYSDKMDRSFETILTETNDLFRSRNISIIGDGFREISANRALFEDYVASLTDGCSADSAAQIAQIMENNNQQILAESLTGIAPIASLSMPVIRKLWPAFALKEGLKTEVAKQPRFAVTYMKPYLFKVAADGSMTKLQLPEDMYANGALNDQVRKQTKTVEITGSNEVAVDFTGERKQPIDKDVYLTSVTCTDLTVENTSTVLGTVVADIPTTGLDTTATLTYGFALRVPGGRVQMDINHNILADVEGVITITDSNGAAVETVCANTVKVIARVNCEGASIWGTAVSPDENITGIKATYSVGISSEWNENSWSVGYDIARKDIDIPTGQHLNAPLAIEPLKDMMAMYQIDGTKEIVNLMTDTFSNLLDLEIYDFIRNCFENQPGGIDIYRGYPTADEYSVTFDCKPAAGFAGRPQEWRAELKTLIDHLASRVIANTKFKSGVFTIFAHPTDVQLISNVDWKVAEATDGVEISYKIGVYNGVYRYKVISSLNIPQGEMFLLFTPSDDKMTYKYYPYQFTTETGYIDPNRSRVPSIMMTKRHALAEFTPAIGCIQVLNNDGVGLFNPSWETLIK